MKRIDHTGKAYGHLTVVEYMGPSNDGHASWKCRCVCGNTIVTLGKHLKSGVTTTCRMFPNHAELLPNGTRVIYLHHKGQVVKCFIDTVDYPLVKDHRWSVARQCHTKYAVTHVKNNIGGVSNLFMHNLLLPNAEEVDHKNHNGLDNRRENLRSASRAQNGANQRKQIGTSSRYKGVHWNKSNGSCSTGHGWAARIKVKGKQIYLGSFANEETAAIAYDIAAIKHFGEYAHLNILVNPHQIIREAIAA